MKEPSSPLLRKQDGWNVGRDPRKVSTADLEAEGHRKMTPLRALRLRCLDCCCNNAKEVVKCTAIYCPSWPFRTGTNPWRAPLTAAQMENAKKQGERLAKKQPSAPVDPTRMVGETSNPCFQAG